MAAALEEGTLRIYGERPDGSRVLVMQAQSQRLNVNKTDSSKWMAIPLNPKQLTQGYKLVVEFTSDAADIIDSTDTFWSVPVYLNGMPVSLGLVDFSASDVTGYTTYQDVNLVAANKPYVVGVFEVAAGDVVQFGGGLIYMDIYDDTA